MDYPILEEMDKEQKNAISKELESACARMERWTRRRKIWTRFISILLVDVDGYWEGMQAAYADIWELFAVTPSISLATYKTVWLSQCEKLNKLPPGSEEMDLGKRVAWARAYRHFRQII